MTVISPSKADTNKFNANDRTAVAAANTKNPWKLVLN